MKRLWVLLLLLLLTGCTAAPQPDGTLPSEPDLSQPPSLTVSCWEETVRAWPGIHHWRYEKDGQTTGSIADGVHPTEEAEKLPRITAGVSPVSSVRGNTVTLTFADPQPDSLSVVAHAIDPTVSSGGSVASTIQGFDLLEGDYVYVLHASWEAHGTAQYAFRGSYTVPQINTPDQQLERLKKQYPQYFDLPTDNGLYVFVWKMASAGYYCGLGTTGEYDFGGKAFGHDLSVLMKASGLSFAQMHMLLRSYDVAREDIHLVPFQHPLSSYYWQTDDTTQAQLELLFWGVENVPVLEVCATDVDGDGEQELCAIGLGPTSGLFSFSFVVREIGSQEDTVTTFVCPWYELHFVTEDGVTYLEGTADEKTHRFDIALADGVVSLTENGQPIGEILK